MIQDKLKDSYSWDDLKVGDIEWFRDLKFGMFFHWSGYSMSGLGYSNGNIYRKGTLSHDLHVEKFGPVSKFGYKDFLNSLNASGFDPDEWAEMLVRSGVKYAGIVTHHCDNFSLFNSNVNPNNAVNVGFHRDIIGESYEAFRKRGIKCLASFHHLGFLETFTSDIPDADVFDPANEMYYGKPLDFNNEELMAEVHRKNRDLVIDFIENYKPDILYFDSSSDKCPELYRQQMADALYNHSGNKPVTITYKNSDFPKGTGVFDIECMRYTDIAPEPWQTDDRLEDNVRWSYIDNGHYKCAERIIQHLSDVVSKNGSLLLNLGPNPDGTWPEEGRKVLFEVGDWLKVNGEAIYGTRPYDIAGEGPGKRTYSVYGEIKMKGLSGTGYVHDTSLGMLGSSDVRFTRGKDGAVYAILIAWPENGTAVIRSFGKNRTDKVLSEVSLLGSGKKLSWNQGEDALFVTLPENRPCRYGCVLKLR